MRLLEPVGEHLQSIGVMAPRPASLNGKVVGVLDGWGHRKEDGSFEMYPLMAEICHLLEARFELGDSFWVKKPNIAQAVPKARLEEVAARADVVLNGQCLWGSCTAASVRDAVELERLGRPTITIAHDRFVVAAKAHARSLGMPALPLLIEPTPASGNIGINTAEVASRNIELVIAALTRPVDQVDQR